MQAGFGIQFASIITLAAAGGFYADAQAPGVPICSQARQESQYKATILNAAKQLSTSGVALKVAEVRKQLKRTSCQLALPEGQRNEARIRYLQESLRKGHDDRPAG